MSPDCPLEVPSSEKAKDTVAKAFFAISASPSAFQGEREVTLFFFPIESQEKIIQRLMQPIKYAIRFVFTKHWTYNSDQGAGGVYIYGLSERKACTLQN